MKNIEDEVNRIIDELVGLEIQKKILHQKLLELIIGGKYGAPRSEHRES